VTDVVSAPFWGFRTAAPIPTTANWLVLYMHAMLLYSFASTGGAREPAHVHSCIAMGSVTVKLTA